jgi:hypothetical protein
MTIRAIGPLLCGGLLVLAATTGGAYAQINKQTPVKTTTTVAPKIAIPADTKKTTAKQTTGTQTVKCNKKAGRGDGAPQMDDCNSTMQGVSTTR